MTTLRFLALPDPRPDTLFLACIRDNATGAVIMTGLTPSEAIRLQEQMNENCD